MTLDELEKYCKNARNGGIDGSTPVCVLGDIGDQELPFEVSSFEVHSGDYKDDPSPKLRAPCLRSGQFVFLHGCSDHEWVNESHQLHIEEVEIPK